MQGVAQALHMPNIELVLDKYIWKGFKTVILKNIYHILEKYIYK